MTVARDHLKLHRKLLEDAEKPDGPGPFWDVAVSEPQEIVAKKDGEGKEIRNVFV